MIWLTLDDTFFMFICMICEVRKCSIASSILQLSSTPITRVIFWVCYHCWIVLILVSHNSICSNNIYWKFHWKAVSIYEDTIKYTCPVENHWHLCNTNPILFKFIRCKHIYHDQIVRKCHWNPFISYKDVNKWSHMSEKYKHFSKKLAHLFLNNSPIVVN